MATSANTTAGAAKDGAPAATAAAPAKTLSGIVKQVSLNKVNFMWANKLQFH